LAARNTIDTSTDELDDLDFGLLFVMADDLAKSRGRSASASRDKLIFELGLLIGALGRNRVFLVRARDRKDLKPPSDVLGVKTLEIAPGAEHIDARIGAVLEELRRIVGRLGPR
jgi:predicted nucleotide-binding protein